MAEETGERRRFIRVICEVVDADVGKLPHYTVKGRHLDMQFIYPILECGGSPMVWNRARAEETRFNVACESLMTFWQIQQRFEDSFVRQRTAHCVSQSIGRPIVDCCQSHKAGEDKLSGSSYMHDGNKQEMRRR